MRIDGGRLTIQGAQDSDAGTYSCIASNVAGTAEERTKIDVGSTLFCSELLALPLLQVFLRSFPRPRQLQ